MWNYPSIHIYFLLQQSWVPKTTSRFGDLLGGLTELSV